MKRSETRILTTHTGSLPRPEGLARMLGAVSRGEAVDEAALASAARESTADLVRAQAEAGIDIINGGEQPRVSFSTYVSQRMSGFGGSWTRRGQRDQMEYPSVLRQRIVNLMEGVPTCTAPLSYDRMDAAQRECDDLLSAVGDSGVAHEELFMTAASPGIITLTMKNEHYPTYADYVFAAAEEMRKEYELIVSKGLVLQLDCPDLAMERHITYQDDPVEVFQEVVELHIEAINRALVNIPRDRVRLHVCWGNSEGPHHYDVPVRDILPIIYRANVGALVMEMANPRHAHEYRVYREMPLPDDMLLVAGVIDTKTNYVEHPEVVADRLRLAVESTGGDPTRVLAGTDCGFDTSAGSNRVDRGVVWLKLRAMREGADLASRDLF